MTERKGTGYPADWGKETRLKKGDERSMAISKKAHAAIRAKWARIHSMREAAIALGVLPAKDQKNYPGMTNDVAAVAAMYEAAQDKDSRAASFVASLKGEMVAKVDVQNLPILRDDIPIQPDPPATNA